MNAMYLDSDEKQEAVAVEKPLATSRMRAARTKEWKRGGFDHDEMESSRKVSTRVYCTESSVCATLQPGTD